MIISQHAVEQISYKFHYIDLSKEITYTGMRSAELELDTSCHVEISERSPFHS